MTQVHLYPGQPCPACKGRTDNPVTQAAFCAERPNPLMRPGFEACANCGAVVKVAVVRPATVHEDRVVRGRPHWPTIGFDIDGTLLMHDDLGAVDWASGDAVAASSQPHPMAFLAVKHLLQRGVRVVFITGRRNGLEQLTRLQLAAQLGVAPGSLQLYMNQDRTGDSMLGLLGKVDALRATLCDVYVGDTELDQTASVASGAIFLQAKVLHEGWDVLEVAGIQLPIELKPLNARHGNEDGA